jgi:predicted O-methyltransferase YrrM
MSKPLKDAFEDVRTALRDPVNRDYLHKSPAIPQALLDECRLYTDRQELIKRLSKFLKSDDEDLTIAEIGTASGAFASFLATEIKPHKIIIVDVSFARLEKERFISPLKEMGIKVELVETNSHEAIGNIDDCLLDLAYIDGSHTLDTVRQDLALISKKIKPGGFLVCNAYASFSLPDTCKYGVPLAFNEFVIDKGWPVVGFALESYGYHGIAAQKPQ